MEFYFPVASWSRKLWQMR